MKCKQLGLRVLSTAAIMSIVSSIAMPAFAEIYYIGNGNDLTIEAKDDGYVYVNGHKDADGNITIKGGSGEDSLKKTNGTTSTTSIGESSPVTQESKTEETPVVTEEEEQPEETAEETPEEPEQEEETPAEGEVAEESKEEPETQEQPEEEAQEEKPVETEEKADEPEETAEETQEETEEPAAEQTEEQEEPEQPKAEEQTEEKQETQVSTMEAQSTGTPVAQSDDSDDATSSSPVNNVINVINNWVDNILKITLDNVNIDVSKTGSYNNTSNYYGITINQSGKAAMSVSGTGNTTVQLKGDNNLSSGAGRAGLEKNTTDSAGKSNSGTLTVTADTPETGSLTAIGGIGGAGIGSAYKKGTSNITIDGGTVNATGYGGAGIGSGEGQTSGLDTMAENITINDGKINAVSKSSNNAKNGSSEKNTWECGAGIGGGYGGNTSVTINGGDITVETEDIAAAGIGKSRGYKDKTVVTITGGTVHSNGKGTAIGCWNGDSYNKCGSIIIDLLKDFTLDATQNQYSAISARSITIAGAENTKLKVNSKDSAIGNNHAIITINSGDIDLNSFSQTLAGQTINMNGGKLTVTAEAGYAISACGTSYNGVTDQSFNMIGGEVIASGVTSGLLAGKVKITGGSLKASATNGNAIKCYDYTLTGGQKYPCDIELKNALLELSSSSDNVISANAKGNNLGTVDASAPAILRVIDANGNVTKVMHNKAYIQTVYQTNEEHYVTEASTTITPATCTTDGKKVERCAVCDAVVKEETLPKLGHNYEDQEWIIDVPATCTTEGKKHQVCKNAPTDTTHNNEEVIPATNHAHTEIRDAKDATCTEPGYTGDKWCTDCNTKLEEGTEIPANGHQHTEVIGAKDPTDTEPGYTGDTVCSDCGTTLEKGETIPALGHEYEEKVTKEPTCTEDGEKTFTCKRNDDSYTEKIPATGHQHTEVVGAKDPTCTEPGYTGDTVCKDCGATVEKGKEIPATGHQHTHIEGQKDATDTEPGYTGDTVCDDCGAVIGKGEAIPAKGVPADENNESVSAPELWVVAPDTIRQTFTVRQNGTERIYTSPYNSGTLTGTMEILQYLQEQGVETIVFTTNQRTSRFAVADLLALVGEGDVFYLRHMDAAEPTLLVIANDHSDLLNG